MSKRYIQIDANIEVGDETIIYKLKDEKTDTKSKIVSKTEVADARKKEYFCPNNHFSCSAARCWW